MDAIQLATLIDLIRTPTPDYFMVARAAGFQYAYPYIPGAVGENCVTLVSMERQLWHLMHIEYRDTGVWIKVDDREYKGTLPEVLELLDGEHNDNAES